MSVSIIVPINNDLKNIADNITYFSNNLKEEDQLILVNYKKSKSQINTELIPQNKGVILYEHKEKLPIILDDVIKHLVINDSIIIVDSIFIPHNDYLVQARNISDKNIYIGSIAEKRNVNVPKIIDIKNNEPSLMNIRFSREEYLKTNGFDDRFMADRSSSIMIDLCNKMKKNGVVVKKEPKMKVICTNKAHLHKDKEKGLVDVISKRDEKIKLKDIKATIILPFVERHDIIPNNDNIIQFTPNDQTLAGKLYSHIKNSNNECIIILNYFSRNNNNLIQAFKEKYSHDMILIDNGIIGKDIEFILFDEIFEEVGISEISSKTSMCFSKSLFKGKTPSISKGKLKEVLKSMAEKSKKEIYKMNNIINPTNRTPLFIASGISNNKTEDNKKKKFNNRHVGKKRYKHTRRSNIKATKLTPQSEKYGMKWHHVSQLPKPKSFDNRKPKVVFVCDVQGWAWWLKSHYLKKYLKQYYNVDIINLIGPNKGRLDLKKYDLYFTYGHSFINRVCGASPEKRITGVTAHRPRSQLEPQMKKASVIHANSMLLFNEVKQFHDIVFYTPNGVDTKLFYLKKSIEDIEFKVGIVGKLSPRKRQQEILLPSIKKAKVKNITHFNNHSNKISHEKMVDIYQDFSVLLTASMEDGTPCPNLEAASCGRPIITNSIGNMPELIKDGTNGFIYPKMDAPIDWYVEKINILKEDKKLLVKMSENIKKEIQKWSWELMAKNYLILFDSMLGIKREWNCYENPALDHIPGYREEIEGILK